MNCWHKLKTNEYINLEETFFSGQIFTIQKHSTDNLVTYHGHIQNYDFIFKEVSNSVFYTTNHPSHEFILHNFFTLNIPYTEVFHAWNDSRIKYNGLRLLRVDPIEAILSFICSQNNNIKRITQLVTNLKNLTNNFKVFEISKCKLEGLKLGYRIRYIIDALEKIKDCNMNELCSRSHIRSFLLSIKGVGSKVCDCILLMGFGFYDVVPFDVHILRMSQEMFKLDATCKKNRDVVLEMYHKRYGKFSGIAQLYLFKYSLDKTKKMKTDVKINV